MSLRNYIVKPIDDALRENLHNALAVMESREHESCRLCGGHSYGAWTCSRCRHACSHPALIHGYIYRNDASLMAWSRCFACGRMVKGLPRGSTIYDLCLRDNRHKWGDPCERCGSTDGSQLHHWAPQAIFADANDWPQSWLCHACHRTWHNAMRAAGGVSLADKVRVA